MVLGNGKGRCGLRPLFALVTDVLFDWLQVFWPGEMLSPAFGFESQGRDSGSPANVHGIHLAFDDILQKGVCDEKRGICRFWDWGFLINPEVASLDFLTDQGEFQFGLVFGRQLKPLRDVFRKGRLRFGRLGEIRSRFGHFLEGMFGIVKANSVCDLEVSCSLIVEDVRDRDLLFVSER